VRILFDQGTPVPLRGLLSSHQVETAFERGWNTLRNSDLLAAADHTLMSLPAAEMRSMGARFVPRFLTSRSARDDQNRADHNAQGAQDNARRNLLEVPKKNGRQDERKDRIARHQRLDNHHLAETKGIEDRD